MHFYKDFGGQAIEGPGAARKIRTLVVGVYRIGIGACLGYLRGSIIRGDGVGAHNKQPRG